MDMEVCTMKKNIIKIIIGLLILLLICTLIIIFVSNSDNDNNIVSQNDMMQQYYKPKERYEYNEFEIQTVTVETLIDRYFIPYKNNALYNVQKGYELLDEEYRTRRFGDLTTFDLYIEATAEELYNAKIQEYTVNKSDEYTQYVCKDQYGNHYIFNSYGIAQYTVMLDTYTIPTLNFINTYNEAKDEEKAALNLNRFLDAIENKDYKYAYSKLYGTFRNNNFPTQADFENYININWLNYENIETVNVENQSGVYVCKLSIIDENNITTERTCMIQLGKGTEYLISFTI